MQLPKKQKAAVSRAVLGENAIGSKFREKGC